MRLPGRRRARPHPEDSRLAAQLEERRAAARQAEQALRAAELAGRGHADVVALRGILDTRLAAAIEAAEAAYRVALGPVDGLSRVAYLARLISPAVQAADEERRALALARSHHRVDTRDDLSVTRPASVSPAVGTAATALGTHGGH